MNDIVTFGILPLYLYLLFLELELDPSCIFIKYFFSMKFRSQIDEIKLIRGDTLR
jgi:hypothetical protein